MEKPEQKPEVPVANLATDDKEKSSLAEKDVASRMYSGAPFAQPVGAAVSHSKYSVPDHIKEQYKD